MQEALSMWHVLEAPYEAARARLLLSAAFSAMGEVDGARLELEAASRALERLGASHVLDLLGQGVVQTRKPGLSTREIQVLRLLATGQTNREIAKELTISEFTVRRHVQNIFAKLGVFSRAAATRLAVEQHLI
jgi:DNA-binding NarL/FixJ family response regulator